MPADNDAYRDADYTWVDVLVNSTALHVAVRFGLESVVRALFPQAAPFLSFTSGPWIRRQTPFHLACDLRRTAIIKLLLQ